MTEKKTNANQEGFTVRNPVTPIELLAQYVKEKVLLQHSHPSEAFFPLVSYRKI